MRPTHRTSARKSTSGSLASCPGLTHRQTDTHTETHRHTHTHIRTNIDKHTDTQTVVEEKKIPTRWLRNVEKTNPFRLGSENGFGTHRVLFVF